MEIIHPSQLNSTKTKNYNPETLSAEYTEEQGGKIKPNLMFHTKTWEEAQSSSRPSVTKRGTCDGSQLVIRSEEHLQRWHSPNSRQH